MEQEADLCAELELEEFPDGEGGQLRKIDVVIHHIRILSAVGKAVALVGIDDLGTEAEGLVVGGEEGADHITGLAVEVDTRLACGGI